MSKHTPGPWGRVFGSDYLTGSHPADIIGPLGYPIGHAIRPDPAEGGDYKANARLIAAAPSLLAACKEAAALIDNLMSSVDWGSTFNLDIARLNSVPIALGRAIAEAEGE